MARSGYPTRDFWLRRALSDLRTLAWQLQTDHPGAAASLREGLEETLTLSRLELTRFGGHPVG